MPTISDVAKHAGVSRATVSRVLQGATNVSPSTRAQVQRVIDELGYVPNAVARSLRSKRTRSLALLVSDVTNTFWTTVARGVEDLAQQHGYSLLLCNTDEDLAKQDQYIDFLVSYQVDGVIIAPCSPDGGHLKGLRDRNIPTVILDRRIEGWDVDTVCGDSISGARALVRHLIGLGHRRIAVLSGPATTSTAEDRIVGYCMALAEASIPFDARLVRRGEYREKDGEILTHQMLDEGLQPTAVFAGNNALAMGFIAAASERGLQIPQDMALVSFDDVPVASRLFPFLTVVTQPAYDLGVNAAQLLLSQLESDVIPRPRQVVLPVRLIVRHSCGSHLEEDGSCPLSLPIPAPNSTSGTLVRPLTADEQLSYARCAPSVSLPLFRAALSPSDGDKSDVQRLLKALRHEEPDRVPHLELQVASRAIYEYVLQRELPYWAAGDGGNGALVSPEDHIDFALRLGMDAVPCWFSWRPNGADPGNSSQLSLASQISRLERYLRAAEGTDVGVIACFSSFYGVAMRENGVPADPHRWSEFRGSTERLMDSLLEQQVRVVRVVNDRFAGDLAAVVIKDDVAQAGGPLLPPDLFEQLFARRMQRLIEPAAEHGRILLLHTGGKISSLLPLLHDLGFGAVSGIDPEFNDILSIKHQWAGKLALLGNISPTLLAKGTKSEIEAKVQENCATLGPGGGYVVGSSGMVSDDVPPENLMTMVRSVHKYGRLAGQDTAI